MRSVRSLSLLCVMSAGVLAGCGGSGDRPKIAKVTGTVYMDEKPYPNVWVLFNPTTGGRTAMARTNEEGVYELMYLEGTEGANIGSHKVVIMAYHEDEIEEARINNEPIVEPIPAKYNTQTTLTAEVKEGNNEIDFHLDTTEVDAQ